MGKEDINMNPLQVERAQGSEEVPHKVVEEAQDSMQVEGVEAPRKTVEHVGG